MYEMLYRFTCQIDPITHTYIDFLPCVAARSSLHVRFDESSAASAHTHTSERIAAHNHTRLIHSARPSSASSLLLPFAAALACGLTADLVAGSALLLVDALRTAKRMQI
jgi:hypothetical protein